MNSEFAIHRSNLNRLLIEVADDTLLSSNLAFKGGTCAQILGFLDRFSVDLDFDLVKECNEKKLRERFHKIFKVLDLTVSKEFDKVLFFQLKYKSGKASRNTIKLSVNSIKIKANEYKVQYFAEIDRLLNSQTIESMFANKLVAITNRYDLYKTIAGRDIYDIHHFFIQGYKYKTDVIKKRTGMKLEDYLKKLSEFIKKHITQTIINEDLNTLLTPEKFQQIRKVLVPETLSLIQGEIESPMHAT